MLVYLGHTNPASANPVSQRSTTYSTAALQFRVFQNGQLALITHEFSFRASRVLHNAWNVGLGINFHSTNPSNNLRENIHGVGPGLSIGYRDYRMFRLFFVGIKTEVWQIHFQNQGKTNSTLYNGKNLFVQPIIEVGYLFDLKRYWTLSAALLNSYKFNLVQKGIAPTKGWIPFVQLELAYIIKYPRIHANLNF
ncbi:MAG: hypothetical protein GC181_10325 [Bacteroidetes bacterium]|nr:hypothetical protein [Bacteroidota bacterium]